MANNKKENKIEKFTKEAIGKTLNQFNKEIGMADLVEINKNQDRILNGILSQVNDENTEKTEKSNIITLDNSTDGIVELKEIQGDTNVNVSKIEEMPITHDIGDKEGNVFTLNEIPKGAISIGEIQGNTMVNCNKDDKKELVLMKDLSTQGDNNITLTEGVDGGKVDVALEGNTLVNVSNVKDVTALPLEEELTYLYANTQYTLQFVSDKAITVDITLGGTQLLAQSIVKGLNRISITTPGTLANNKLTIDGAGAEISEVVVTDTDREFGYFEGMKSVGECEDLEVVSSNSDNTLSNTQTLTHEPLRAVGDIKDKYVLIDGKWYIERNCKEVILNVTGGGLLNDMETEDTIVIGIWDYTDKKYNGNHINDTFKVTDNRNNTAEYIYSDPWTSSFFMRIKKSRLTENTLQGVKTWLENNPIRLVYELATPTYEPIDYNPFEVYSDVTHITTNSAIPTNITIKNHGYNCLLKPSTTYTVSSNQGLSTVTTGADIGDSCLRFYNEDTSTKTTMRNALILEGDWTSKADLIPSNFSGIESCFEQELVTDENDEHYGKYRVNAKVVGKNLFDTTTYLYKADNTIINSNVSGRLDFMRDKGKTQGRIIFKFLKAGVYYFSANVEKMPGNLRVELWQKDKEGNFLTFEKLYDGYRLPKISIKITLTRSGYIGLATDFSGDNIILSNIQIEQGDTATEYEPYKENNITFYLNKPLRGTDTVKDKIFIQGDKVIVERNCGSYILDGSADEVYVLNKTFTNDLYSTYTTQVLDAYQQGISLSDFNNTRKPMWGQQEGLTIAYQNYIYVSVRNIRLQTPDVNGFKQWLQVNPITVVYQLAEPTYEEVEYSSNRLILDTFNNESFNNSTLFLDTTILPKLSFKPLWEELVYVKNSTKYYIQFNAVGSGEVVINLGGTELTTEIAEGYNCIPITTPSESTNLMTMIGQGITISEVVVSEVICGGYYKGLQSCFEEHMENGKYRVLLRGIALDGSKVNGIKLYINEPLRGIRDVKDRLCIKNGKLMVERKCASVTFDGGADEGWALYGNKVYEDSTCIHTKIANKMKADTTGYAVLICDKLQYINSGYSKNTTNISTYVNDVYDNNNIYIRVMNTQLSSSNVQGVRQWLQQNPIKVVYQLTEPTYEEATNEYGLPIVFEGYENGIVYIDSAVTPTTHIKYTSNNQLATTLSEAEEQNITTQEDINMNVITYMMDIDMMLTDMEMSNDISVMAVRRDNSNENMLDRMSEEDKKVYQDNTVVMLEKMITANVLEKEDIEGRIDMYYNKNRISKEQYKYLKSLL